MFQAVSKKAVLYSAVCSLGMFPVTVISEENRSAVSTALIKKTLLTELQTPILYGDSHDTEIEDMWCYRCQPLPTWAEVAEDQYADGGLKVITVAKLPD